MSTRVFLSRTRIYGLIVFALGFWMFMPPNFRAMPQSVPTQSQGTKNLIDKLNNEQLSGMLLNEVVAANATEAIPILREKFAAIVTTPSDNAFLNDDLALKGLLASALVRLGEKDGKYWSYLADQAKLAVESDAPFPPFAVDNQGNYIPKQLSQEFQAWAKAHKVSPESAARNEIGSQLRLTPLARTGDRRGLPILRKALSSRNYLVQAMGAQGLALLRDSDSVPLIISACTNARADAASVIAWALVFFDDASAQKAAERFIPDVDLLETLKAKNREKGPRGLFEW